MKWLLTRVLAGLAAIALLLVAAGGLLAHQFSGEPASWASSQGADAAWVGSWEETDRLAALLDTGGPNTVYVYAGEIAEDGSVERVEDTASLLSWLEEEYPDVRPLAWLRHVADGSSLVEDRFDADAREELTTAASEIGTDGFAGVHLEIRPVTVNDPSMPTLVERLREELDEDSVLSLQAHHVELVPGGRVPSFVMGSGEKYWSKGYLGRVSEHADEVVLPGVDAGMPGETMYGGFMVRQVTESLAALERREELTVRFGLPTYTGQEWGPDHDSESALTALAAVRLGMTRAEPPDELTLGVAFYVADEAGEADLSAYTAGWLLS